MFLNKLNVLNISYEDKVLEHITEYNYLKMSEKYQNEQNEIMGKLKKQQKRVKIFRNKNIEKTKKTSNYVIK